MMQEQNLLDSLTCIFQINQSDLLEFIPLSELQPIAKQLNVLPPTAIELVARTILGPVLDKLPAYSRVIVANLLKKIRNPSQELPIINSEHLVGNQLIEKMAQTWPFKLYGEKQYSICLCHDVDTRIGYDFLPVFIDELNSRGLTSSFYFITQGDYTVEPEFISELETKGFEVGLHGATHDIGIAYRNTHTIRDWLEKGISNLGIKPRGFRSPGLSISSELLNELDISGFVYDSSMQYGSSLYHSTSYAYPFFLKPLSLIEAPVWFQDAYLFRDSNLSHYQALEWCKQTILKLKQQHATVTFLLHPDNMVSQRDFLSHFLDFIAEEQIKDAQVCPLIDIVDQFKFSHNIINPGNTT